MLQLRRMRSPEVEVHETSGQVREVWRSTTLFHDHQSGRQNGTMLGKHLPRRRDAPKASKTSLSAPGGEGKSTAATNDSENSMIGTVKLGNVIPVHSVPLGAIDINLPAPAAKVDC